MPSTWSWGSIVGYSLALAATFVVAQIGAAIAVAAVSAILVPGFNLQAWATHADTDGVVVGASTFAAAMLCIPLVRIIVGQHEREPWSFLGIRPVTARTLALACGAMLAFIAVSDTVNVWLLDRPLVPPFMTETYATARKPAFLFVAIVIVAPATEELLFRGFLFGALRAKGVSAVWAVAVTTLLFTLVHTQYDVHDMVAVLLIGLMLGLARARWNSIVPTTAMHALSNAVAFIETAWLART